MQRFARIASGVVAEIITLPDGADKAAAFHADIVRALVLAPDESVVAGWTWNGGSFAPPPPPPPPTVAQLVAHARNRNWQVKTGGIVVSGIPVRTDDRTRTEIGLARADAASDPTWSTRWQIGDGSFVTIDAAKIEVIGKAVSAHVRACFAKLDEIEQGIAAGTITTAAQIDAAAWPPNG